jgi:hypothetical protein
MCVFFYVEKGADIYTVFGEWKFERNFLQMNQRKWVCLVKIHFISSFPPHSTHGCEQKRNVFLIIHPFLCQPFRNAVTD